MRIKGIFEIIPAQAGILFKGYVRVVAERDSEVVKPNAELKLIPSQIEHTPRSRRISFQLKSLMSPDFDRLCRFPLSIFR
jgi:hypothetical protein